MERVQAVRDRLPAGAEPRLAPITGLGEVFTTPWPGSRMPRIAPPPASSSRPPFAGSPTQYTVKSFRDPRRAWWRISAIGGLSRQFVVQPDPAKLRAASLTFGELAEVIARNTDILAAASSTSRVASSSSGPSANPMARTGATCQKLRRRCRSHPRARPRRGYHRVPWSGPAPPRRTVRKPCWAP